MEQVTHRILAGEVSMDSRPDELARALATFHADGGVHSEPDSPGTWQSVRQVWVRECDEVDLLGDVVADRATRRLIRELGLAYLDGRHELFDARVSAGQIREGHGVPRCEHVYLTAAGGGATYPSSLLEFYIAYRALVSAKVRAIRVHQTGAVDVDIAPHARLAVDHLRRAIPVFILVGGLPGSGKSALAAAYASAADVVAISSDEIRHGLAPQVRRRDNDADADVEVAPWEADGYCPAVTEKVYEEMLGRARTAVSQGCSVLLDASWRDDDRRRQAKAVAAESGAIVVEIRCVVEERVAIHRLARTRAGYSRAGVKTRDAMRAGFGPWPEATVIDTDREVGVTEQVLASAVTNAVEQYVAGGPRRLS
jgi:predicted kinase